VPATIEISRPAFAGESQANRKYLAFARRAEKDGLSPDRSALRAGCRGRNHSCPSPSAEHGRRGHDGRESPIRPSPAKTYEYNRNVPAHGGTGQEREPTRARPCWNTPTRSSACMRTSTSKALACSEAGKIWMRWKRLSCPVCGHLDSQAAREVPRLSNVPGARYPEDKADHSKLVARPSGRSPDWIRSPARPSRLWLVRCRRFFAVAPSRARVAPGSGGTARGESTGRAPKRPEHVSGTVLAGRCERLAALLTPSWSIGIVSALAEGRTATVSVMHRVSRRHLSTFPPQQQRRRMGIPCHVMLPCITT